jgi:hypothetical protein
MGGSGFNVETKRGPGGFVPFGDHLIPENFTARVVPDDASLPLCELDFTVRRGEPKPVVVGLRCHWRGFDAPINGEALRRLPIDALRRQATHQVAFRVVPDPEGGAPQLVPAVPPEDLALTDDQRAAVERQFRETYAQQTRAPRRRGPLRDEDLRHVAQVYRAAIARGQPPTRSVAEDCGVARSTAGRWVAEARRRGVLGPAKARQPGEVSDEQNGGQK